jgi:hypothetical protein
MEERGESPERFALEWAAALRAANSLKRVLTRREGRDWLEEYQRAKLEREMRKWNRLQPGMGGWSKDWARR